MSHTPPKQPPFVGEAIIFTPPEFGRRLPPPDTGFRAVHKIRLSAISHNYTCVESAATRQRCSVIVVVKADGYGHGAIESAIHLADNVGADAFAVATLEEGIALRKAFESTPPPYIGHQKQVQQQQQPPSNKVGAGSKNPSDYKSQASSISPNSSAHAPARTSRPPQIRIIVLGPPVGYPRCFDDYYHHGIEVMCSGPEVAKGIMEWITDEKERKRTQVERSANDTKAAALLTRPAARDAIANNVKAEAPILNQALKVLNYGSDPSRAAVNAAKNNPQSKSGNGISRSESNPVNQLEATTAPPQLPPLQKNYKEPGQAATLGNVSGQDLAKEVRAFLMNQKAAQEVKDANAAQNKSANASSSGTETGTAATVSTTKDFTRKESHPSGNSGNAPGKGQVFGGIEALAKNSRTREMAAAKVNRLFKEDSGSGDDIEKILPAATQKMSIIRKRLRYHILVDSGMGRLGFKTVPVEVSDVGVRRDTVEIINELVETEVNGAPIEFFGMCTHMADANSTSTYTNDQMNRFKGLLKRVRGADIAIPTCSTDNSAALLTTTLTHFDAKSLLAQPHSETRGYVRTGGAIYGQRPAFKQLRAASTLMASVRHVAILKTGESVGYDRAYLASMSVRIATLTIGFADGYPRDLGNGTGKVAIRGHIFPVAGNVCMDMMMVELGPADDKTGPGAQVVVGDTAILWGPQDENDGDGLVRLQDVAATLKTTQSALTCGLDKIRVSRQYTA